MFVRRAALFFLIVLLLVGIILLPQNLRADLLENPVMSVLSPVQAKLTEVVQPLSSLTGYLGSVSELNEQKAKLESEVAQLTSEVARLREIESENKSLRGLVQWQSSNPEWHFLEAGIISRDPSNLVKSAIVNKGTKDGVKEGMTVLDNGNLAGRVIRAFETSSKVMFVTDPSSSVNGMIQRSRVLGVVKGKTGDRLVMDYLGQQDDVQMRDLVVTSGIGGGFPKGIPIGFATAIRGRDVEPFLQLDVEPLVDPAKIESVVIILNFTPIEP